MENGRIFEIFAVCRRFNENENWTTVNLFRRKEAAIEYVESAKALNRNYQYQIVSDNLVW